MDNFYPDILTIYLTLKMLVLYDEIIYFNFKHKNAYGHFR